MMVLREKCQGTWQKGKQKFSFPWQQGVQGNMMGALRRMLGVIGIGKAHT
jgi:hypothetical protein